MPRLATALALPGFLLALAWPAPPGPEPPAATVRAAPPGTALRIRLRGGDAAAGQRAREALARVLATGIGKRARRIIESGALPGPVTIEVNDRGDQFTRYRVPGRTLGETIVFDPDRLPLVETDAGPLPALAETVLAHELGHAVFKLRSEEAVILAVENPVRDALQVPRRRRF
jgi:hypothetical protein